MNIADYRREYTQSGLSRADLELNPLDQFDRWFKQAISSDYPDANAMTLVTVSGDGRPSARNVLLKGYDEKGFVFFTNYGSQKARQIEENNEVALLFSWLQVERQIEISGTATRVSQEESEQYFHSRPVGSQLGAWASRQSQPVDSRELLIEQLEAVTERFGSDNKAPLPEFWGGYRVEPHHIEFWQGRESRLHDRFEYSLLEDSSWKLQRLQP